VSPHRTDPLDGASLGVVAWVDHTGSPRAAGVLPLLIDGRPVLALTLDRADLAVQVAAAEVVQLMVREPRNTAPPWRPAAWRCRSHLVEDLEGDIWLDRLRLQELRRYPPARRYADSFLLCREHWWYLPRLLVDLEPVEALPAPPVREGPADLELVTARDGVPVVSGVRQVDDRLDQAWGPQPAPGPGVILGQDATFPDLEVWDWWTRVVEVRGPEVRAEEPLPHPAPPHIPGLRQRWRRERAFARACRRGIAAWGR